MFFCRRNGQVTFVDEPTIVNNQFSKSLTMISNSYCESGIVIFACKVTLKYVYSPFNMFSSPGFYCHV